MSERLGTVETLAKRFAYLDNLRESGATNMYGARPWIQRRFGIDGDEAGEILTAWMKSYDGDKTPAERAQEILSSPAQSGGPL